MKLKQTIILMSAMVTGVSIAMAQTQETSEMSMEKLELTQLTTMRLFPLSAI